MDKEVLNEEEAQAIEELYDDANHLAACVFDVMNNWSEYPDEAAKDMDNLMIWYGELLVKQDILEAIQEKLDKKREEFEMRGALNAWPEEKEE